MGLLCWTTLVQHQQSSTTTAFSFLDNRPPDSQNGRTRDHERTTSRHGWYSPTGSRKSSHLGRRCRCHCPISNKASLLEVEEDSGGTSHEQTLSPPSLESLTVKELRQMVKDSHHLERGILSRLKLKKDLIAFLLEGATTTTTTALNSEVEDEHKVDENGEDHHDSGTTTTPKLPPSTTVTDSITKVGPQAKTIRTTTMPMRMPSSSVNGLDRLSSKGTKTQTADEVLMSPKERMFEKVYERYPHVREMATTSTTAIASSDTNGTDSIIQAAPTLVGGLGEEDIRQQCHPIFQNCSASSDMDVVFVGTASCTPGVTRGVSCTALRLNWKRRSVLGVLPPEAPQQPHGGLDSTTAISQPPPPGSTASSFLGGTWMFDCGECTQVRFFARLVVRLASCACEFFPFWIWNMLSWGMRGTRNDVVVHLICTGRNSDAGTSPREIRPSSMAMLILNIYTYLMHISYTTLPDGGRIAHL
jgi:hypothetical protein